MNRLRDCVPLLTALLCSACSLHRIDPPARTPQSPPRALQPAQTPPVRTPSPQLHIGQADAALLAQTRARYNEARSRIAAWEEAGELGVQLDAAEQAARGGDAPALRSLCAEILRRSTAALDVNDLLLAQLELQKLQTYTGLSDAQLARMRTAEVALAKRQGRRAYLLLSALTRELANATRRYVVAAGDSLWIISGRPEVYGNPYLWPLIWQANLDSLSDPNQLRAGQRLKIRSNPTVEEVVQALDTAHHYAGTRVRIGEVRDAAP
jgi:nucleoid-associated protein YgaU